MNLTGIVVQSHDPVIIDTGDEQVPIQDCEDQQLGDEVRINVAAVQSSSVQVIESAAERRTDGLHDTILNVAISGSKTTTGPREGPL